MRTRELVRSADSLVIATAWTLPMFTLWFRGFTIGVALLGLAALWRLWTLRAGGALWALLRTDRGGIAAAPLAAGAYILPALIADVPHEVWRTIWRTALVYCFFGVTRAHRDLPTLRLGMAWGATVFVVVSIGVGVVGIVMPELAPEAFIDQPHLHSRGLPRLRSLTHTPGLAGVWGLLALGAVRSFRTPTARATGTAGALAVIVASLSPATLSLPAVFSVALVSNARRRVAAATLFGVAAVLLLWIHPLELRAGDARWAVSGLHPAYAEQGLGPRHHPIHTLDLGPVELDWHATAYAHLAGRAVTCFLEHPLAGVGPGDFGRSCPVTTMGTYGEWRTNWAPHGQIGAWIAELGLLGCTLLAVAFWLARRAYVWDLPDRWTAGALVGVAVTCASWDWTTTVPVMGFIGAHLAARPRASTPPEVPRAEMPSSEGGATV